MRAQIAMGVLTLGAVCRGAESPPAPDPASALRDQYVSLTAQLGALERNTLRYFFAIDAHLGALATLEPDRFEDALERWFAATERYPRQLHEVDHDEYIAMKRNEYLRQQQVPP